MITYEDCISLTTLTDDEVEAIRSHEHTSSLAALEYGAYLETTSEGEVTLKRIIIDDINEARGRGDTITAAKLRLVLQQYCKKHCLKNTL